MYYSHYHEWILVNGKNARVGITDKAQAELKEIVFIELPVEGQRVSKGDEVCVVESTKAATDLCSPLTGEITKVNHQLKHDPMQMQRMAQLDRWIYEIAIDNAAELNELVTEEQYQSMQRN